LEYRSAPSGYIATLITRAPILGVLCLLDAWVREGFDAMPSMAWVPAGQHPPVVSSMSRTLAQKPIFRDRARTCIWLSDGRALGQPRSNTSSLWTIRQCGQGHGQSRRSSPSRATRRTDFITSLVASKETMPSLVYCVERARKNSPLQRDEVLIRRQETAPQLLMALRKTHCGRS